MLSRIDIFASMNGFDRIACGVHESGGVRRLRVSAVIQHSRELDRGGTGRA